MSFFKVKRDEADKLWSEYIRRRDGRCVYCGKTEGLTCSHYHGRRKESVRFDSENCDALCFGCHMKLEHEKGWVKGVVDNRLVELPKDYTKFKLNQLGELKYNMLAVRAETRAKKDRKFHVMRIKELLKKLR